MNIYQEMQAAIREAWATTDPQVKKNQIELVGDTHIPTPEELIRLISAKIFTETT